MSDREFAPQLGSLEWNFIGNRSTGIYALALRKDVKNPFPPESDEVKPPDARKADGKAENDKDKGKGEDAGPPKVKEPIAIDFDGLADRVVRVPVSADNYAALTAIKGHLIYGRRRVVLLWPRVGSEARAADLLHRRSQGDDAGRRDRRLRIVGRRLEGAGEAGPGLQPL